jgi:hypothetical protein
MLKGDKETNSWTRGGGSGFTSLKFQPIKGGGGGEVVVRQTIFY